MKTKLLLAPALTLVFAVLGMGGMPAGALPPGTPEGNMVWTPGVPTAERDATFGVSARDPDGVIISVRIDFGDGTFANLPTAPRSALKDVSACAFGDEFVGSVRHQYLHAGTYSARVTIVGGSCPLTGVVQDATWTKGYVLSVVKPASSPAPADTAPGGITAPGL